MTLRSNATGEMTRHKVLPMVWGTRKRKHLKDLHGASPFNLMIDLLRNAIKISIHVDYSRMRSEGFLFLSGGSGGGTVFVPISGLSVRERPRTTAHVRFVPDALSP